MNEHQKDNCVILKVEADSDTRNVTRLLKELYLNGLFLAQVKYISDSGSDCAFNLVDTSRSYALILLVGNNAFKLTKEKIILSGIQDIEILDNLNLFSSHLNKFDIEDILKHTEKAYLLIEPDELYKSFEIMDLISKSGLHIVKYDQNNDQVDFDIDYHVSIIEVEGYDAYNRLKKVVSKSNLKSALIKTASQLYNDYELDDRKDIKRLLKQTKNQV